MDSDILRPGEGTFHVINIKMIIYKQYKTYTIAIHKSNILKSIIIRNTATANKILCLSGYTTLYNFVLYQLFVKAEGNTVQFHLYLYVQIILYVKYYTCAVVQFKKN